MQENDKLATIAHEAHEFMRGFQSLTLATSDTQGKPEASYATFVQIGSIIKIIYYIWYHKA